MGTVRENVSQTYSGKGYQDRSLQRLSGPFREMVTRSSHSKGYQDHSGKRLKVQYIPNLDLDLVVHFAYITRSFSPAHSRISLSDPYTVKVSRLINPILSAYVTFDIVCLTAIFLKQQWTRKKLHFLPILHKVPSRYNPTKRGFERDINWHVFFQRWYSIWALISGFDNIFVWYRSLECQWHICAILEVSARKRKKSEKYDICKKDHVDTNS
jgi:hypothetical protein